MTGRSRAPPSEPTTTASLPTPSVVINGDDEEDLKSAWREFDHSLNGSISPAQFRQMMAGLGENVDDEEVEGLLNSVDGEGKITCELSLFLRTPRGQN